LIPFPAFGDRPKTDSGQSIFEFLEFRMFRDGQFDRAHHAGRQVIEGSSDRNSRFVDQAYAGSSSMHPKSS